MQNHFYEIAIKSHTFIEADDFKELEDLIREFFEMSRSSETVEIEYVDSEYL